MHINTLVIQQVPINNGTLQHLKSSIVWRGYSLCMFFAIFYSQNQFKTLIKNRINSTWMAAPVLLILFKVKVNYCYFLFTFKFVSSKRSILGLVAKFKQHFPYYFGYSPPQKKRLLYLFTDQGEKWMVSISFTKVVLYIIESPMDKENINSIFLSITIDMEEYMDNSSKR